MSDYTPTTDEIADWWAHKGGSTMSPYYASKLTKRVAEFDRWLAAHDAEKHAEWEAEQGETEWEIKRVEQARIHYRYGVNSGTLLALNTPESIASEVRRHEHRTMGPIGVEKIETRAEITHTSPWMPVPDTTGAES